MTVTGRRRGWPAVVLAAVLGVALIGPLTACTADPTSTPSASGAPPHRTLHVPGDASTIQAAVDQARSGDLVLVAPGTYHEAVVVEKAENLTIRGEDRNRTVLDGQGTLENGIKVFRNGVAVENLTVRDYTANGVLFTGDFDTNFVLSGYRASYVTAHRNGEYGLYAFNASHGVFDHDYGSGHKDSAFYVGQCDPCDAVITDSLAEHNMLGYSGTNATGVTIVRSEWRRNMIGVVPNSNDGEKLAPQKRTTIAGNWVHDNTGNGAPASDEQYRLVAGNGILVTGGLDDVVTRNLVEGNGRGGIGIMMWPFRSGRLPAFEVSGNRVTGNVSRANGSGADVFGDLWLWTARASQGTAGNCFEGNTFATSTPPGIETVAPCTGTPAATVPSLDAALLHPGAAATDPRDVPAPADQPQMPDATTAPAVPATPGALALTVDLAAVTLPAGAGDATPGGTTPGPSPR